MAGGNAAPVKRIPTVADSIELTVLTDPDANSPASRSAGVKQSPDGQRFFIITRKGNLATGCNDYALLLYQADDVRQSIARSEIPAPTVVARFSSSSNRPGITQARWLADNRTIALLGENPGEVSQLYLLDSRTKALTQLTHHATAIIDFDLNATSQRFVYLAHTPPDWSQRTAHGYEVGVSTLYEVMGKGQYGLYTPVAAYIGMKDKGDTRRIEMAPYRLVAQSFGMWLSPSGRWSIVMSHAADAPDNWWEDYAPVRANEYLRGVNSPGVSSFTADHPSIFMQYVLVDMLTGQSRPLLDAPSGQGFGGKLRAHWSADEASVILANTFLPLNDVEPAELTRNRLSPAVAQVDLGSGKVSYITPVLTGSSNTWTPPRTYSSSTFDGHYRLEIIWQSAKESTRSFHCRTGNTWRECDVPKGYGSRKRNLSLSIAQGLNQPPQISSLDPVSGRSAVITDLNPQLSDIELGTAEVLRWTDKAGRDWTGGLLRPIHAVDGQRFPLVILTHGFDPSVFLMDGPGGAASGYAARALAGRGMMVLQVDDTVGLSGFREELSTQLGGYEAAIDKLDAMGLVDPRRVGIHGWSRTGYYVQHALVFSPTRFAVASVADPSALGVWTYSNFFGFGYPGMLEYERMLGTQLWGGDSANLWAQRDPSFHLDRVRAPLRIETYEYGLGWWDTYTILRRHRRAVELLSFPDGAHLLVKPWERLSSQEGTVDWHDFWLNGHEDPSPSKADQYARWRKLRAAHEERLTQRHDVQ